MHTHKKRDCYYGVLNLTTIRDMFVCYIMIFLSLVLIILIVIPSHVPTQILILIFTLILVLVSSMQAQELHRLGLGFAASCAIR